MSKVLITNKKHPLFDRQVTLIVDGTELKVRHPDFPEKFEVKESDFKRIHAKPTTIDGKQKQSKRG